MAAAEERPPSGPGSESEDEKILYDLLVNTEWPPETEVQPRGTRKHGASFIITKAITECSCHFSPTTFLLPDGLVRLVNKQINCTGSARDEFTSIIGKCQVPKDPSPQWRRVAWSYDCTLLAYAESTGTVRVFDLVGSELFIIPPASSGPRDLSYAVAGLIFLEYKASAQWSAELLVINYRGELRSYLVSVGTNQSYRESHSFSFGGHYPHGVSTAIYHPGHRLLLVGGCESDEEGASKARALGLSAWRVLSGSPYYKPVSSSGDGLAAAPKRLGLLRILNAVLYSRQGQEQDGIYKMSLSPDGTILATIHFSGKLSFWTIPSLKQLGEWSQEEQPGYDEINPHWRLSTEKRKKIKDKESFYPLIDVNWWADNAVTLARCSGALTVSSVKTLKNLLGKSCEWFEPSPQLTAAHDGGFLSLECETRLGPKRSRLETRPGEDEEGDEDSDSGDELSAKARYFGYIKQGLYFVTEMERFAPPRKRPRTLTKNYRLVSLRSTTPEELYQRKIESEEYQEALALAHTYGLDTDLVYQRQWRKSTVSSASIHNYLSKIKKRSWVLHECLERVPENAEAAKELLEYGLKGTDLEALLAIGKREDDGRFLLPGEVDIAELPYEDLSAPAGDFGGRDKRAELLQLVNFSQLTLEQKELCRCRLKLLTYLDRLATYEVRQPCGLQGEGAWGPAAPPGHSALWLALFAAGSLAIFPWNEQQHRDKDWCEEPECRMAVEPGVRDEAGFLYEAQPELLKYRTARLPIELVTEWYCARGEEIEHCARQVDCALSLIRLGMERNIPGLLRLCDDLVTLETLVYEAGCDLTLTLRELQQMKAIDQLRLLMESSSEEQYVTNAYQWMVPLLHRWEKQSPGAASQLLKDYLVTSARADLRLPLKIFQHSKPDLQQKIIPDQDQLMEIALECIYSCERDDQLSCCYDILECLPQRGYGLKTAAATALHDRVDQLEQILSVSELLEKHGLQKPISFVKNTQADAEEARKLMIRLTRHTGRKQPQVSESHWKMLLQDMLAMQRTVYTCLEPDACYEIFTESLLCASRLDTLHLAGQMMQCSASPPRGKAPCRVGYEKSVALVLAASREYFNSSTSLSDSCMDLARSCLQLITDCPSPVQEELDLIRALGYLEEFGVKILPLQVRLCPDRLSLIKECIAQAPTSYRQSAKLLGLAGLLQVAGEDHEARKGQVLVLLVQQALRFQDHKAASMHCQELMATGYSPSWDVCSQLGQCEGFRDLAARQELMAFALTHCPPGSIEDLLAASSSLQTEVLYQRVNFQMHPCEGGESPSVSLLPDEAGLPSSQSGDLLHWTTATTMKVLSNTTTTTKAVLHAVSDGQWWKKSLAYLRPLHGQDLGDVYGRGVGANAGLHRQGCHPFYESLLANPFISESEVTYTAYQHVAKESFAEVLLRTGKLAETKSEGDGGFPTTEVLLQLASDAFPHDLALALAYLLALPQVVDANKCFEKQAPSALVLQLAAYYYSLQIYSQLAPCFTDRCHPLYRANPSELVQMVTKHVSDLEGQAWPEGLGTLVQQLGFYHERLLDLTQAQLLRSLHKGVDVPRFAADTQYKRETILGLAGTLEKNVYTIALSLAQRYHVPRWEVYMTHLEFLFTDSGEPGLRARRWLRPPAGPRLSCLSSLIPEPGASHRRVGENTWAHRAPRTALRCLSPSVQLSVDTRTEMTRRALATVQHFIEKRKKRHPDARDPEAPGATPAATPVSYDDVLNYLEQSLAHLGTLSHSFITSLRTSEQEDLRRHANLYDLSRSEEAKIRAQAVTMCLEGRPLAMVWQLLEVAVGPLGLSPKTVVHSAVTSMLSLLSGEGPALPVPGDPLQVLDGIISSVHASVEKGEGLLSADDLLAWFRPFCADDSLPVKPRVQVLQSMERSFQLTDEDRKLLVFFRTEAILKATWPQTQVSIADIESEAGRRALFLALLEASRRPVEFQHLALLLQAWPPGSTSDNPWLQLASRMLSGCPDESPAAVGADVLALCRSLYHTPQTLPPEGVKELALLLLSQSLLLPALKLLVESQDGALQALALEHIAAVAEVDDSNCDAELLSLLLDAKLVARCIATALYPRLIDHLLAHQGEGLWSVEETARELRAAGYSAEAGSLLLASRGTFSALRTFTAALSAAQHWL
uniref:NBAS subunit of NRZ tethering complex n=1 Tax=Monodelphis domestica TaxID=13616 RepID=F6VNR9_MONDO